MKLLKYVVLVFTFVLMIPFVAFAEGETEEVEDYRVAIYFFHGDGCPHCAEAEEWFDSIQDEYGSKFVLKKFEVWNDADNAALMEKVNEYRGDNATGVPYIICGDQSWVGFSADTMAKEITDKIDEMYNTPIEDRYDVLAYVNGDAKEKKESIAGDVVALILILVVVAGVGFGIYKARQTTN